MAEVWYGILGLLENAAWAVIRQISILLLLLSQLVEYGIYGAIPTFSPNLVVQIPERCSLDSGNSLWGRRYRSQRAPIIDYIHISHLNYTS
ncbi:hypothetical protein HOY82DRAFT_555752 [Tuber indicum]|nr:hypothetical protein HOY82DRAFT_555752 [Tuber indicum]